ncbi:MAG: hypothetical protein N2C14_16075, partial [Planctomycetales bacterium]
MLLSESNRQRILFAAFSPDGRRVVTGSGDPFGKSGDARVWDCDTGKPLTDALRHRGQVNRALFSPDGQRILTQTAEGSLRIWDAASGKSLTPPRVPHGESIHVAFSGDGALVLTETRDPEASGDVRFARVWDASTGDPVSPRLKFRASDPTARLRFLQGGEYVAAQAAEGLRLWRVGPQAAEAKRYQTWAQWLAARRIDVTGTLVELETSRFQAEWNEVRRKVETSLFADATEKPSDWHARQANRAEALEEWHAASFHLNHLISASPNAWRLRARRAHALARQGRLQDADADYQLAADLGGQASLDWHQRRLDLWNGRIRWSTLAWYLDRLIVARPKDAALRALRGNAHAELGEWEETISDYAKASELDPSADHFHALAVLCLWLEDPWTYRVLCEQLADAVGGAEDPETIARAVRALTLNGDAFRDSETPLRLAEQHLASSTLGPESLLARGYACYRGKRWADALGETRRMRELNHPDDPSAWLLQAMTHYRLKQPQEARRWLTLAKNWLRRHGPAEQTDVPSLEITWRERVSAAVLLREA